MRICSIEIKKDGPCCGKLIRSRGRLFITKAVSPVFSCFHRLPAGLHSLHC